MYQLGSEFDAVEVGALIIEIILLNHDPTHRATKTTLVTIAFTYR